MPCILHALLCTRLPQTCQEGIIAAIASIKGLNVQWVPSRTWPQKEGKGTEAKGCGEQSKGGGGGGGGGGSCMVGVYPTETLEKFPHAHKSFLFLSSSSSHAASCAGGMHCH